MSMRAAIAILLITATFATGADIDVDLGSVTVPDAQVDNAQLWMDSLPNLYTQGVEVVTNDAVVTTNTVNVLVPEGAKAKATRTFRSMAVEHIRTTFRAWKTKQDKRKNDNTEIIEAE